MKKIKLTAIIACILAQPMISVAASDLVGTHINDTSKESQPPKISASDIKNQQQIDDIKTQLEKMIESKTVEQAELAPLITQLQNLQRSDLNPQQILEVRRYEWLLDQAKKQIIEAPKNSNQTLNYNDTSDAKVNLSSGYVSTVQFFDSFGNPYPIEYYVVGNASTFTVCDVDGCNGSSSNITNNSTLQNSNTYTAPAYQKPERIGSKESDDLTDSKKDSEKTTEKQPDKPQKVDYSKKNILILQTNNNFAESNLIVKLVGRSAPLAIKLRASPKEYNERTSIQIVGTSPASENNVMSQGIDIRKPDRVLLDVLNGTPPMSAKPLTIPIVNTSGWEYNGSYYIRTQARLLSPPFAKSIRNTDGVNVYEISPISEVILSYQGRIYTASVTHTNVVEVRND